LPAKASAQPWRP
jgi:hypothetical protein